MIKIQEIIINDDPGFFCDKNFTWQKIGAFSVIAGINGSGKTKLLEYVANSDDFNKTHVIRYIDVYYKPPLEKHANELARVYNYSLHIEDGKYYSIDKDGQRKDWTADKSQFKGQNVLKNLDYAIIDSLITERINFQNNTKAIRDELNRIEKFQETGNIQNLLPAQINNDQPWDRIDRILNAFGLLIRIDRMNLNACLKFFRRSKANPNEIANEIALEMKELSSGEKVAFALALWTWGNSKGKKTDLLLVDEFDAHLNPSIAEKFITIVKEYFVDLDVQVIMTTHHPSTVAYANNAGASIIWMEDGIIDSEMSYENIIRVLSNGLIDINYLIEETQLLIENRQKYVIYTEGKTDKKHIESAIKALSREKDFEDHYIFGCTGADTVPFFIGQQTGQSKRIVLLDSDDKGKKVYQRIMGNPDLKKKIDEDKLGVVFVSSEDGKVIEDLYDSTLRTNKSKEKFASHMALASNQTATNFANFTALLDRLLSCGVN